MGLRTDFINGKAIKSYDNKQIRANRRTNQELERDIERIKEFLENQRQKSSTVSTIPNSSLPQELYNEENVEDDFLYTFW